VGHLTSAGSEAQGRRALGSARTRAAILSTARRLFAARPYSAVGVRDIAAEAAVAVQTIYDSVGGKPQIVMALLELIEDEASIPELAPQAMRAEDGLEVVRLSVHMTRRMNERCADIIGAVISGAQAEPRMAELLAEGRRRHRSGFRDVATRLQRLGALRSELSICHAGDAMAALSANESYRLLTGVYNWSFDRAEDWIVATIEATVLDA